MKTAKTRCCLVLRARVSDKDLASDRHESFFENIRDLPEPWGLGTKVMPRNAEMDRLGFGTVGLTRFFGASVKSAMISYVPRTRLSDSHKCDDILSIDINPAKIDMQHFCYVTIPKYIVAFGAYLVQYFDERFVDVAYSVPAHERTIFNRRTTVSRVDVLSYYDRLLCELAFGVAPSEIRERVSSVAESTQLIHDGIYVIGSSKVITFDEAQLLTAALTRCVTSDDDKTAH